VRPSAPWRHAPLLAVLGLAVGGCDGVQSALAPHGPEAHRIALLTWILVIGSAVILVAVMVLTVLAMSGNAAWRRRLGSETIVIGGGIVFPAVTLSALLLYGLLLMRAETLPASTAGDPLRIAVVGERYWWRVIYRDAAGNRFESANELRIPLKRPVEIELTSADVIHSFWVPRLAGKLDMIPGRRNVLRLAADVAGVSRGQCAEYCGGAHALMAFYVVAMTEDEHRLWLARESAPAGPPAGALAQQGMLVFLSYGCGACHTIRGTDAAGTIGPDLTHVGSRLSLAAATLPNHEAALAGWIADGQRIKPENLMPPFRVLPSEDLVALAHYLKSLK
jgi:cytochrome c oxidase subunit 2